MATFYISTRTGSAGKSAGTKQVAYISGLDRHADKFEIKHLVDKNIPAFAKNGVDFFQQADILERANGRSYRRLVIAIPREAKDIISWSQNFVDELLKDKHAYRLAIHDKGDGNPHAHLMFSERGLKEGKTPKDFFSRQNTKDRSISHKNWLIDAKKLYLTHIRKVAPDYVPKMKWEPKIGPKLKNASPEWKARRDKREIQVHKIRQAEDMLHKLNAQIVREQTEYAFEKLKPKFAQASPEKQERIKSVFQKQISKPNKDGSLKKIEQVMAELTQIINSWIAYLTEKHEKNMAEKIADIAAKSKAAKANFQPSSPSLAAKYTPASGGGYKPH